MAKVVKTMFPPMTIQRPRRFAMPPPPHPDDRPVISIVLEEPATIDPKAWKELVAMAEKHGGARPGAGRKVLDEKSPTTKYLIAVTAAQREKIDANGGAPWVRGLIDAAPDKKAGGLLHAFTFKDPEKPKIQPDPEGLKGREREGIKSAKAVAKRLKAITPKKP